MKKLFFTMFIVFMALTMTRCAMAYADPQYEESYNNQDYAYLDDYSQVNWNDAQYDMEYTYYDMDRMFLVVYNGKIFVIPYEYFYRYIYPRFRARIIWRSYDYFCGLWGWNYYNNLWNGWYYRHYRSYWRAHYDWYDNHKRRNNNRPFIIRRNELQRGYDGTRYQVKPQPRNYTPRNDGARIYVPHNYTPRNDGTRNYNYVPRNERNHTGTYSRPQYSAPQARPYTPTPVKHENNGEKH